MTNKWKCSVCRYVIEAEEPPEECPECHGKQHKFKPIWKLLKKRWNFID
ncbi:rubredoxin [Candidatus Woesearchaeota archaeon]|mgnify:CR=1 FL=1|nr:rubredoxin [Candidatus Woesearchaeota archaeon]HIH25545.1 rubredoxin [Nanoarchaeota archaeon]